MKQLLTYLNGALVICLLLVGGVGMVADSIQSPQEEGSGAQARAGGLSSLPAGVEPILVPVTPVFGGSVREATVEGGIAGTEVPRSSHSPLTATERPTAVVSVTTAPSHVALTEEEVYTLALSVSGDEDWSRAAVAIVFCESRGELDAVGSLGERGSWQVRPEYHGAVPADALGQFEQAYAIWQAHGFTPWSCR